MPKIPKIHPLDFNTSGSATIRFFGPIVQMKIHAANAKIPQHQLICLKSFSESESCPVCKSNSNDFSRYFAYGWDCNAKRWAFYLAPIEVFSKIANECQKAGATEAMTRIGHGPDVFIQRVGMKTEVAIATETIGKERGPGKIPSIEDVLESVKKQSIWNKFQTVEDVECEFPKDASPDKITL